MHGDYAKGLFYILCIVVIWTFSSVLVQHVFLDLDFDGPFILTYVCSTLFSVYLLVHCANKSAYGSQLTGPEYAALPTPNLSSAEADEVIPGFSFNQTLYACLSVMPSSSRADTMTKKSPLSILRMALGKLLAYTWRKAGA